MSIIATAFVKKNSLTTYQTHLLPTQLLQGLSSVNRKLLIWYQQIVNTLWPSDDKFLVNIVSCTDFLSNISRTVAWTNIDLSSLGKCVLY